MPLPDINLDDLRFQRDLVDEARKRIVRYAPEWTEYNVSDPGITLIELFAWMTELLVYRLNRVPEKNYVRFLDMLGVRLGAAHSARALLTFRLSAPFPLAPSDETVAFVPSGLEIATQETPTAPQVIFTVDESLKIQPPHVTELRSLDQFNTNWVDSVAPFLVFRQDPPQKGATFYIGFDPEDRLALHIIRLTFHCDRTEAYGVRRDDPPLVWEVSTGGGTWEEIVPSRLPGEQDTTGGLNNEVGSLVFYLPEKTRPDFVQGLGATWIRCRYESRREGQGSFSQSPRVRRILAHTLGASTWTSNAVFQPTEDLGVSNGDPGQSWRLRNAPVLPLRQGETLEVEEVRDGETVWVQWERVEDFSRSDEFSRHFTFDTSVGEIRLGPVIRQPNGAMRAYGRVPHVGARLRMSRYRTGGGAGGNVPAHRITQLRSAVPYIDRVYNSMAAYGGLDPESLDGAMMRARGELRAQDRAVTAEDFENLALRADRSLARVKCLVPGSTGAHLPPGMLELLLVPAAQDSVAVGDFSRLALESPLINAVQSYLDQYRLLTTTLTLREPRYIGVRVKVRIVASATTTADVAQARVIDALRRYLAPLPPPTGDVMLPDPADEGNWPGWQFGKSLYIAEIYALVQRVRGVRHVLDVQLEARPMDLVRERASLGGLEGYAATVANAGPLPEPTPVSGNILAVPADGLLCSLDHQVEVVAL